MRPIDADALKNELCKDCMEGHCTRDCYEVHLIKAQPTIEAEPVRRARWIAKGYPWDACSLCGTYVNGYDCWKYCPYCGAQMEASE